VGYRGDVSAIAEAQVCCRAEYHGGDQQANDVRCNDRQRRFTVCRRSHAGLKAETDVCRRWELAWLACSEDVESAAQGGGSKKQYENSFNHKRGAARLTVQRGRACWAGDGGDQRAYLLFETRTGAIPPLLVLSRAVGTGWSMLLARTETTAFPGSKRPFYSLVKA